MVASIADNGFPQKYQHFILAMLWMDTGPAQLHHLVTQALIRHKIEFAGAVIAEMVGCVPAGLQPVGAYTEWVRTSSTIM